jgi:hypothetical protein
MTDIRWIPGEGPDEAALERLRKRFPRPSSPMGEAWFMGQNRRMFDALMARDPASWPEEEIEEALSESASGPICFGHMREWSEWFPYLLHASIGRVDVWRPMSIFSGLVANVMVHCPNRAQCPYGETFIDDVLATLGRLPMAERFWFDRKMTDRSAFQPVQRWPVGVILADQGDLHAAYWLMAKYLLPDRMEGWLRSVMAIADPAWGCGFLSWLVHAEPIFEAPERWPGCDENLPGFWIGASALSGEIASSQGEIAVDSGPFLESANVASLQLALTRTLDPKRLIAWRRELEKRDAGDGIFSGLIDELERLSASTLCRYRPS